MIIYLAMLFAIGTAGFFVGGINGVAAVVVGWMVTLVAYWRIQTHIGRSPPGPVEQPQSAEYADIDDVVDRLEDLAQKSNWGLGKRFEIARMACENPTTAFDELERRYERGIRSAFDKLQRGASQGPKNDENSSACIAISSPPKIMGVIGQTETKHNTIM